VEEKPPQQKPNGTAFLGMQQNMQIFWVLTGDALTAEALRNTKSANQACTCEIRQPYLILRYLIGKKKMPL
jgi:hypothetical protein